MMNWHIVTSAEYHAGTVVEEDLYFLSDTFEIYRGSASYTQPVGLYETLPTTPATDRLYINKATLEGRVYDGANWTVVLKAVTDTVTEDGDAPVTGAGIAAYVSAKIAEGTTGLDVVTEISYAGDTKTITYAKGDSTTGNFKLTGLGCSLSTAVAGNKNSIQLVDIDGAKIGDPIELDIERFVTGAEYDSTGKNIILYFDGKTGEESTDKIVVPVADLVDVYTVEGTNTVDLTLVANKITAAVKISAETGNALVAKDDGLYVPTVDTSDLMPQVPNATAGNIPVLDASGMLTDSGKAISDIGKPNLYTGTSIDEAVGEAIPKDGDFCVVSVAISDSKSEKTAYIYDKSAWVAMDGNYNAENVYFDKDLLTTAAIGNITLVNGQATIAAAGKNLKQVFDTIFVKETNPTVTQPSASISAPNNKAYEVGTNVTPSYTATLKAGTYQFGPATGITATSWAVTDTNSGSATTATGSFTAFTVEDGTNYKITAVATYEDGAIPKTNTGNDYPAGQIKAGSKSATSAAVTGYRCGFYGTATTKDDTINSAFIRGLSGKTTAAPAQGNTWTLNVPVGAMRVVFAYPATLRDVNSVLDVNGLNAEIKTAFTKTEIDVEGANGYTAKSYKVFTLDFATANDAANTYKINI